MKAEVVAGPRVLTNILGTNDINLPAGRFAVVERPSGLAIAQTPGIELPERKPQLLMGGFFSDEKKAGRFAVRMNLEEDWVGRRFAA